MPLVERRYAEALIDVSMEGGAIDNYRQELQSVVEVFNTQNEFRFFFLNPRIKAVEKKEMLKKLFDGKLAPMLVNFLMLLVDKGRIKSLPGILEEFVKLADKKRNVLNMTIVSAAPLSELQINEISEKYRRLYNASYVKADIELDKALLGGVRVRIGDRVVDGTVKGRLESIKEMLVSG